MLPPRPEGDVLIIGGTGSLGKALIRRWRSARQVHVYSRDEAKHWTIRNEVAADPSVRFHVGDIRDRERILKVIEDVSPTYVVVAAALKQVDTCELSPDESVLTNLTGTQNVIDAVRQARHSVRTVLFVSTDKACSPINVYGMCKALSERLITSQVRSRGTRWLCTRYGNVLESRGSIIPLFRWQGEHGAELTVTDPRMTRFVMTLDEAVDLINLTLQSGESGQTWIPNIRSMNIGDLASIFSEAFDKPIKVVGLRPGEKMHEELMNAAESARCYRMTGPEGDTSYVIGHSDQTRPMILRGEIVDDGFHYTSDKVVLSKEDLRKRLVGLNMLTCPMSDFEGRRIEEIVHGKEDR